MSEADDLFRASGEIFQRWNLTEIPFCESASSIDTRLDEVFTGRTEELKRVFTLLRGRDRKTLLIYGWIGIGKTAFILEVLSVLQRNDPTTLTAYIKLQENTDLATAALIALAREMPNDDWAQYQLNKWGLRPDRAIQQHKKTVGAKMFAEATVEEQAVAPELPKFPALSFEDLLERALQTKTRVVIAIDDLDKQDPSQARQLLLNAQGLLKGKACFLITGHPGGITRDYLIADRGLFDLPLELTQVDLDTSYTMLSRYLASARLRKIGTSAEDLNPVHPFTPDTARVLCKQADGVPRLLNRIGSYVLLKAAELNAPLITPEVMTQGLRYAQEALRGQPGLTPYDYYVLDLVIEKGTLSDETITTAELERLKFHEFSEVMPILDKLVTYDLLRRLPTERAAEYAPIPLLMPDNDLNPEP